MAKPPKETIERIVHREMPGYRVVDKKSEPGGRDSAARPQADTPDVQTLRVKYLRRRFPASDQETFTEPRQELPSTSPTSAAYEDAIVAVEPEDRSGDGQLPGGRRSKRVIISGEKKKIIGRQG